MGINMNINRSNALKGRGLLNIQDRIGQVFREKAPLYMKDSETRRQRIPTGQLGRAD